MKKSAPAVVATISSVLLVSSSAFAFCISDKPYDGGNDRHRCSDVVVRNNEFVEVSAEIEVQNPNDGIDYFYQVEAIEFIGQAGGVLLDSTGSVMSGVREDGTRGPCSGSFFGQGFGQGSFACTGASAALATLRVFAESE